MRNYTDEQGRNITVDHRGRRIHDWGIVAQFYDADGNYDGDVNQCQSPSCLIYEDSDGNRYRNIDELRKAHPALNDADSDVDFWGPYGSGGWNPDAQTDRGGSHV